MTTDAEKVQGGVQSLEIGLTVLDALMIKNAPLMLKELAEILSMHPAKVHRYVVSLIRKGYAKQLEDGRYSLGDRAHYLALNTLKRNDLLQSIQPFIIEIQLHLNCSVHVSKWLGDSAVVVQSLESSHPINIITRVGSRMPLLDSATGRLQACYQPEKIIQPLLEKEWHEHPSERRALQNWGDFLQLKQQILAQGYSVVTGEMLMGVNAISIAIFDYNQELAYVATCIGTHDHLPSERLDTIIQYLLSMQAKIQKYIQH